MKKISLLFLTICLAVSMKAQQDTQFSQYIFNGLYINPAYAGYKEELYLHSSYRSQWQGVKGAPETFSVSADGAVAENDVGLGLIVSSDKLGAQRYLTAYANYAYRLRVGYEESTRLSFGIAAGVMQLGIDGNELNSLNPDDEVIPTNFVNLTVPDARAGVYYSDRKFFAGLSFTNLLARYMANKNTNNLLVPVPEPHLYFTTGALFTLSDDVSFKPLILIKEDFKGPTSLDLTSFLLLKESIWVGAFYRTSVPLLKKPHLQNDLLQRSAMGLVLELFATPDLRIGYSFDYALNKFRNYNYGTHELSVGLYISGKRSQRSRLLRCYDF